MYAPKHARARNINTLDPQSFFKLLLYSGKGCSFRIFCFLLKRGSERVYVQTLYSSVKRKECLPLSLVPR